MDLRICGTILIGTAMICLTWYMVTVRRMKNKKEAQARRDRMRHNERMSEDASLALYLEEEARRKDAEAKVGIRDEQLRKRNAEIKRLKELVKYYENEGGMRS